MPLSTHRSVDLSKNSDSDSDTSLVFEEHRSASETPLRAHGHHHGRKAAVADPPGYTPGTSPAPKSSGLRQASVVSDSMTHASSISFYPADDTATHRTPSQMSQSAEHPSPAATPIPVPPALAGYVAQSPPPKAPEPAQEKSAQEKPVQEKKAAAPTKAPAKEPLSSAPVTGKRRGFAPTLPPKIERQTPASSRGPTPVEQQPVRAADKENPRTPSVQSSTGGPPDTPIRSTAAPTPAHAAAKGPTPVAVTPVAESSRASSVRGGSVSRADMNHGTLMSLVAAAKANTPLAADDDVDSLDGRGDRRSEATDDLTDVRARWGAAPKTRTADAPNTAAAAPVAPAYGHGRAAYADDHRSATPVSVIRSDAATPDHAALDPADLTPMHVDLEAETSVEATPRVVHLDDATPDRGHSQHDHTEAPHSYDDHTSDHAAASGGGAGDEKADGLKMENSRISMVTSHASDSEPTDPADGPPSAAECLRRLRKAREQYNPNGRPCTVQFLPATLQRQQAIERAAAARSAALIAAFPSPREVSLARARSGLDQRYPPTPTSARPGPVTPSGSATYTAVSGQTNELRSQRMPQRRAQRTSQERETIVSRILARPSESVAASGARRPSVSPQPALQRSLSPEHSLTLQQRGSIMRDRLYPGQVPHDAYTAGALSPKPEPSESWAEKDARDAEVTDIAMSGSADAMAHASPDPKPHGTTTRAPSFTEQPFNGAGQHHSNAVRAEGSIAGASSTLRAFAGAAAGHSPRAEAAVAAAERRSAARNMPDPMARSPGLTVGAPSVQLPSKKAGAVSTAGRRLRGDTTTPVRGGTPRRPRSPVAVSVGSSVDVYL